MGRKLNSTVLVDGRIYDAGTDEVDVDGYVTDSFWDGEPDPDARPTVTRAPAPGTSATQDVVDVSELREVLEALATATAHTAAVVRLIAAELDVEVPGDQPDARSSAAPTPATAAAQPTPPAGDRLTGDYAEAKLPQLQAEIETRNEGRAAPDRIMPGGKNKPDLIAALVADDAS